MADYKYYDIFNKDGSFACRAAAVSDEDITKDTEDHNRCFGEETYWKPKKENNDGR